MCRHATAERSASWPALVLCSVAMALGLAIDAVHIDPTAIVALCSRADGWLERGLLHARLLPGAHVGMAVAMLAPIAMASASGGDRLRHACAHGLRAAAMSIGMIVAMPLAAAIPSAGSIAMLAVMIVGMAVGMLAVDALRCSAVWAAAWHRRAKRSAPRRVRFVPHHTLQERYGDQYQPSSDTPRPREVARWL